MYKKIVLSLFFIFGVNSKSVFAQVGVGDSLALVALYDSTDGHNWDDTTGWNHGPVDTWYGVTVSGTINRVTMLNLIDNNLVGIIPSSIGDLDSLTGLFLCDNQLTGSIPLEIGNLTNLRYMSLYTNQLTGPIPTEIGNLTNSTWLHLGNNQLTGTVPAEINNLTKLSLLYLYNNDLEDLPSLSGLSSSLLYLKIENNKFTFEDIEPNIGIPSSFFTYSPQDSVGEIINTTINEGSTLTISVSVGGDSNQYQ